MITTNLHIFFCQLKENFFHGLLIITLLQLSNAGILTQLGIGSAQLSAQKVTPQQALSSSLTQLQPQTRQPTSGEMLNLADTSQAIIRK